MPTLIQDCEVEGEPGLDVRIEGARIHAIGRGLDATGATRLPGRGGALLAGLHDHHLHLLAWAAALRSIDCGPGPEEPLATRLALAARASSEGWLRGTGYHESVAGPLDRAVLDGWVVARPLRIQHRTGALWVLNSVGVDALGLDRDVDGPGVERDERGRATGRVFDADAWLRERLDDDPPDLAPVGRRLTSLGVTGVTDATPGNDAAALGLLESAARDGLLPQELVLMGRETLPESHTPGVRRGPLKILLREAALPGLDVLTERIAASHRASRPVAIHAVTRAELVLALVALREAGPSHPGDRVEHASIAPPELVGELREQGLTVVTQPNFVHERGDDYLRDVEPADQPWLYRCRGFTDAGVPLGAGTDAPFGDPDPWCAMRAAVERRTREGASLGPAEALTPERALALFQTPPEAPGGAPRRVEVGAVADLVLLSVPWSRARDALDADQVAAVLLRGELDAAASRIVL